MSALRVFVATELNEHLREEIARIQTILREAPGGRAVTWVKPRGIHLTFKFLGDTEEQLLPKVFQVVEAICRRTRTFTLAVQGLGCFPRVTRPRVVWVGLDDVQHYAQRLAQSLENDLAGLGFERENRIFQPHITLGRVRSSALSSEAEAVGRSVMGQNVGLLGHLVVDHVSVIQSTLSPSGSIYQVLAQAPLQALK